MKIREEFKIKEGIAKVGERQVEIVSAISPKERWKNQVFWYLSLLIVVAIITYMALQWWIPKYHSNGHIEEISFLYREFKELEKESAINTPDAQRQYDELNVKRHLLKLDELVDSLKSKDRQFIELAREWDQYSKLLRHNLPSKSVVNALPQFESDLEDRHREFVLLVESFAQDLDYKRSFSIETVREIEQLVIKAYKIKSSLNRLLSINLENKAEALSILTEESNGVEEIFLNLRQGAPANGIQSLHGTLEEEALNEIEFAFEEISADIQKIVTNVPRILELREGLQKVEVQREQLDQSLQREIVDNYEKERQLAETIANSAVVLAIVIALAILLIGLIYIILSRRITQLTYHVRNEREQNEYHEMAILNLIDQLEILAQGDLSVELTVTDDSTGIIADSINVAIEKIRHIVGSSHRLKDKVINQLKSDREVIKSLNQLRNQISDQRELVIAHIELFANRMSEIEHRIHQINMADRDDENLIREHIRFLSELIEANNLSLTQMMRETVFSQRREVRIDEVLSSFDGSIKEITYLMGQLEEVLNQFVMPAIGSEESNLGFQLSEIKIVE